MVLKTNFQYFLSLESCLVCSSWTRISVSTRVGEGMGAGIPQDKKRVRKGYSLIQLILHLKELELFRFKEG